MAPAFSLYATKMSLPCRLVFMTCDMCGVEYDYKEVDLFKGEQKSEWFLKLNPQHGVPVLQDGDFVLTESRAIAQYVANAYAKDGGKLYPKEPKVRAKVDQMMYFDTVNLFRGFLNIFQPCCFENRAPPQSDFDKLREALRLANGFVKPTGYAAGTDHVTLADLAFAATVSNIVGGEMVDMAPYPDLMAWLARMEKEIANYDHGNGVGLKIYSEFAKPRIAKFK